jgi:hypothetical protein
MGPLRWASGAACLLFATGCLATESLDGLSGGSPHDGSTGTDSTSGGDAPGGSDVVDAGVVPSDAADASDVATPMQGDGGPEAEAGTSYSVTVLADSPLAYWRVDEMSGSTAHDSSGHGNDATYIGSLVYGVAGATPDGDTAVTLDGTSGALQAGTVFSFAGQASMSLEVWVMPKASMVQYAPVACNMDQSVKAGYLLWVRAPSTGSTSGFERWIASSTTGDKVLTSTAISSTAWHHLVATYDGTNERLYLDGVLQAATASSLQLATNGPLYFGRNIYDGAFYGGGLDEVAVYDHALAGNRVLAHYQASGR